MHPVPLQGVGVDRLRGPLQLQGVQWGARGALWQGRWQSVARGAPARLLWVPRQGRGVLTWLLGRQGAQENPSLQGWHGGRGELVWQVGLGRQGGKRGEGGQAQGPLSSGWCSRAVVAPEGATWRASSAAMQGWGKRIWRC